MDFMLNLPLPAHYNGRPACGFHNLVGTSVYGGHNLPPPTLVGIGVLNQWSTLFTIGLL